MPWSPLGVGFLTGAIDARTRFADGDIRKGESRFSPENLTHNLALVELVKIEEVHPGDVVRIPAGQKHWHGAAPHASMTHVAISEHREGAVVHWMEQVSDESSTTARCQAATEPPRPVRLPSATPETRNGRPSGPLQQKLAPGMASLTDDVLYGDVWTRPELSPRDRSLVTITALIALGKTAPLAGHLGRALDNGLQPGEASGLLAHLAVYCGWPSAAAALDAYDQVYTARKVDTDALKATGARLPALPSAGAAAGTSADALASAPKFVQLTNTWCSAICGDAPICRSETEAWLPLLRSPPWVTMGSSTSTCVVVSRAD